VLRLRGRQNLLVRRRLRRRWANVYAYPGSIGAASVEPVGVKTVGLPLLAPLEQDTNATRGVHFQPAPEDA